MKFVGRQISGREIEMYGDIESVRLYCKKNLRKYTSGVIFDDNDKPFYIFYRKFDKFVWERI